MATARMTLGPLPQPRTINHGDTIVSARGVEYIFLRVVSTGPAGMGTVVVTEPDGDEELTFYAIVFPGLKVVA